MKTVRKYWKVLASILAIYGSRRFMQLLYRLYKFVMDYRFVKTLHNHVDELSQTMVEQEEVALIEPLVLSGPVNQIVVDGETIEHEVVDCCGVFAAKPTIKNINAGVENDNSMVKDRRHRWLPGRNRDRYKCSVISEIKLKLGTPAYRASNVNIVRRLARQIMENHGVRPSHQWLIMNDIIIGVFTPTSEEVAASNVLNGDYVAWQQSRMLCTKSLG